MKKQIYLFVIMLVLTACKYGEIDNVNQLLAIEKLKTSLLIHTQTDNLLTAIIKNGVGDKYIAEFEDGEPLEMARGLVLSYNFNRDTWRAPITLSDNTIIELPSLGDLNIKGDSIKLDPFRQNPLSALVKVEMPVKGKFKIKVVGKPMGGISIENTFETQDIYHEIPVLGLYENYQNSVVFTFMAADGKERASQTIALVTPEISTHPTVQVNTNNLSDEYRGLYFPAQGGIGIDQRGELRWYYAGEAQFILNRLKNGNLIISSGVNLNSYHSPAFYEVTMLGQIIKKYPVPNYLHHDVAEMPNGNFLVLSNSTPLVFNDGNPEEDVIIEMERDTGTILKSWNFNNILDPQRTPLPSARMDDIFHLNAVYYDHQDGSVVVSSRSQSIIAKIDYSTGALKWILGSHGLWTDSFQPYLLNPIDQNGVAIDPSQIDFWTYGQHSPKLLDNGNILVYDNGDYRGFYENPAAGMSSYTRAVEYKIDVDSKKVQIAWQYDYSKQYFTEFTGSINRSNSNTYVIGLPPRILELNDSNTIVFDVTIGVPAMYRGFRFDPYKFQLTS